MPQHITIERRLKRELKALQEEASAIMERNLDLVHEQGGGELSWRDRGLREQYEALQPRIATLRDQLREHEALIPRGINYARYGVGTNDEDYTPRKARKRQHCQGVHAHRSFPDKIERASDCTEYVEPGEVYVEVRVEAFQGGNAHCLACVRAGKTAGAWTSLTLDLDPREAYGEGYAF